MGRKPWKTWSVSNNTDEMSTLSVFTHRGLIHKHRYDLAHLCVCVKEKERNPQVLSDGFMVLRAVFMSTLLVLVSMGLNPHCGGHIAILGPSGLVCPGFGVATAIATAFTIRWPLNTPGPPRQLSAQFSCNVQKTDTSLNVKSNLRRSHKITPFVLRPLIHG